MIPLENDLKSALARREPPAGFAERVMARVPQGRKRPARPHAWIAAAAAALIAILGGSAFEYQRAQKLRLDGERAKAELVLALEIASQKLQHTKAKVLKISEDRI
jgi:hypothetical protein